MKFINGKALAAKEATGSPQQTAGAHMTEHKKTSNVAAPDSRKPTTDSKSSKTRSKYTGSRHN